ncbi:MAG: hypothetical protein EAY75_10965 [Bacteroidetes bacterium]|nr:MAG: hypothetical protein EAY75_10965 [Bacteroidota bacterium]
MAAIIGSCEVTHPCTSILQIALHATNYLALYVCNLFSLLQKHGFAINRYRHALIGICKCVLMFYFYRLKKLAGFVPSII